MRAQLDAARARAIELQRSHDAIAEEAALAAAAQERVVSQIRDGHEKERRLLKAEAAAAAERAARWADTVKRAHEEEVATATAKLSRERAEAHERTWELRTKLNEKAREAAEAAAAHSEADRERRAAQAALAAATSELASTTAPRMRGARRWRRSGAPTASGWTGWRWNCSRRGARLTPARSARRR